MPPAFPLQQDSAFATLRQFARKRAVVERCEMCSQSLAPAHEHLVEPANRRLICACGACAILFEGQSGTKYKRVPRRVVFLKDFQMTDAQWDGLMVPIEMAFFFHSTPHGRTIALYPSPAGPTESLTATGHLDGHRRNQSDSERDAIGRDRLTRQSCRSWQRFSPLRVLPRSHRRMLQAGRSDPCALAWTFRRHRSLARDQRVFRRAEAARRLR